MCNDRPYLLIQNQFSKLQRIFFPCNCRAIINDYFQGTCIGINSFQLQSKLINAEAKEDGKHLYMASLQKNDMHICSSGIFRKGFLISTAHCAGLIEYAINTNESVSAVLGHDNLDKGMRYDILGVKLHQKYLNGVKFYNYDIGVVMVS